MADDNRGENERFNSERVDSSESSELGASQWREFGKGNGVSFHVLLLSV